MRKTMITVLFLAVGLLGWYYYSSVEEEHISYREEKNVEENELSVLEPQALSEHAVIESKEEQKDLPAKSDAKQEKAVASEEKEEQILEKYRSEFLSLQDEYMGKINALIGEAKAEYIALPKDKRSEAKVGLGVNYLRKGYALESECDTRFNAIIGEMQSELQSYNLPTRGVQTAKEAYESQKDSRREILLSKAM